MTIQLSSRRRVRSTGLALVLAVGLVAAPGAAADAATPPAGSAVARTTAAGAEASPRARACDVRFYRTQLSNIRWGRPVITLSHLSASSNPGPKKTVSQGTTRFSTRVAADVAVRSYTQISAGGVLKKLAGKASTSLDIQLQTRIRTAVTRNLTVKQTVTIPRGGTVAWYRGSALVKGRYDFTRCERIDGKDSYGGVVKKHVDKYWSSYTFISAGGVLCGAPPRHYGKVARVAQRRVCG